MASQEGAGQPERSVESSSRQDESSTSGTPAVVQPSPTAMRLAQELLAALGAGDQPTGSGDGPSATAGPAAGKLASSLRAG